MPVGKTATLIGEVTLTPVQEPNWVHDSQTCEPSIARAGLSWNCVRELAAIWVKVQAPVAGFRRSSSTPPTLQLWKLKNSEE